NRLLALMQGCRDASGIAVSLLVVCFLGVVAWDVCSRVGGYDGALLGLALVPSLVVVPAFIILIKRVSVTIRYLKPSWDNG
ncbi:lipid III flippase WzxE, partial [Salmonella enterica subsp. enterica serovar Weltevreden]|nr:lipid III flippase WzxE [Salmonella enterica subsp. enterica serovar Weltevreden]